MTDHRLIHVIEWLSLRVSYYMWRCLPDFCGLAVSAGILNAYSTNTIGVCTDFIAIFQVAQNPLKLAMLTLFVLQSVFSSRQINMDKIAWKSTPFLSVHIVGFRSLRTETLCVCNAVPTIDGGGGGGGGGGGPSWTCLKLCMKNLPNSLKYPSPTGQICH